MQQNPAHEASIPNPALKPLGVFVGKWNGYPSEDLTKLGEVRQI